MALRASDGVGQKRGREAKEVILGAAIACLLEDGYASTTTLRVQERAQVSRGKLLHHFPSKRELLGAATKRLTEERLDAARAQVQERLTDAPAAEDTRARLEWMLRQLWKSFAEDNFWVAMEIWTAARTDPELSAQIIDYERSVLSRVRANAQGLAGPVLSAHPRFPMVHDLVFTSMRGMALTYSFSGKEPATEPMFDSWFTSACLLLDVDAVA